MESADFKRPLLALLTEAYGLSEAPTGFFLETGQSGLFGQIHRLDAALASTPVPAGGETIAGHCSHLLYTCNFFLAIDRGEQVRPDWKRSWIPATVNEEEWDTLRSDLRASYEKLMGKLKAREEWPSQAIGASMMMLAHTVYHVGVLDKMLTLISQPE